MAFSASSCLFFVDFRGIRPCNQATAVAGITHQSSRMSFLPTSVSPRVELLLLTGFIIFTVGDFDDCCPCFPSLKKTNVSKHHPILLYPQGKMFVSFLKGPLKNCGCLRRHNTPNVPTNSKPSIHCCCWWLVCGHLFKTHLHQHRPHLCLYLLRNRWKIRSRRQRWRSLLGSCFLIWRCNMCNTGLSFVANLVLMIHS